MVRAILTALLLFFAAAVAPHPAESSGLADDAGSSLTVGPQDEENSRKIILTGARVWAESVANGDADALAKVLADDFRGVSPAGRTYDKQSMLKDTREAPKYFVSNRLNDVVVRFFGADFAVAQGDESWVRRDGRKGRFVWTDTWVRRNGEWRIVAAQDAEVFDK